MHSPFHCLRIAGLVSTALLIVPAIHAAEFLTTDTWPIAAAEQALADTIGSALLHDITISDDRVSITADHPSDPEQTTDYYWDGATVYSGMSMPNFCGDRHGRYQALRDG